MFTTSAVDPTSSTWIPDSGASFHVTGDSQNIQQFIPFEGPDQIYFGNGEGLPILASGSSCLPNSLYLHNLLDVLSITKNLFSVSTFSRDNHVYFEFHSNFCLVKSQTTNKVLLRGVVGSEGLYSFPNLKLPAHAHVVHCHATTHLPSTVSISNFVICCMLSLAALMLLFLGLF